MLGAFTLKEELITIQAIAFGCRLKASNTTLIPSIRLDTEVPQFCEKLL